MYSAKDEGEGGVIALTSARNFVSDDGDLLGMGFFGIGGCKSGDCRGKFGMVGGEVGESGILGIGGG